jgi:OOP family OmpA-OmpF porin
MKLLPRAAAALLLSTSVLPAFAADYAEMRPYVSGLYSHTFESDDRNSDRGRGYQIGVGKAVSPFWNIELNGFLNQFNRDGAANPNQWREFGGKLDGLFFYSRNPAFSPYFGVGAGMQRTDLKGTAFSDTNAIADAGLGFIKYFEVAGVDLGFRADARYRFLFMNDGRLGPGVDDLGEPVVKIGLVAPLGPKPVVAALAPVVVELPPVEPAAPEVLDTDKDGILDTEDFCPASPTGEKVDDKGCSRGYVPVAPKPVTPSVNDRDRDGVLDNVDLCPNSPLGSQVDSTGCPPPVVQTTVTNSCGKKFDDVYFAFDRSALTTKSKATLNATVKAIKELQLTCKDLRVELTGHTDARGTDAYNQALGERRANIVRNYLVRNKIPTGIIRTNSLGESQPIAPNDNEANMQLNRRTEVRSAN